MSQADLTIESSGLPQAAPDKLSPQTVRLLGVLPAVGIAVWNKRSAAADEDVADLRDESRFAGSMP